MGLSVTDCSPFDPQPRPKEAQWLSRLQASVRSADCLVHLSEESEGDGRPDEPVVYCERDGSWWAGRYIGALTFEGAELTIKPRLGLHAIRNWFSAAMNLAIVEVAGRYQEDEAFILQLLGFLWGQSLITAARHGLPGLRIERNSSGLVVRGRLDVQASITYLAQGMRSVAFTQRERSLDHAISRAIVAAYAVLSRFLGRGQQARWLPDRANDILHHLKTVTGSKPRVPSLLELRKVRYTPITQPFRSTALLSRQIAVGKGFSAAPGEDGACTGVLLDVAELWELYVLNVARRAARDLRVAHPTSDPDGGDHLLHSLVDGTRMARLKPDVLLSDASGVRAILDAKYKRLRGFETGGYGPQREDLYQMSAYLSRYGRTNGACCAVLAYPEDPDVNSHSLLESRNPWRMGDRQSLHLLTLPHDPTAATHKLGGVISRSPVGHN